MKINPYKKIFTLVELQRVVSEWKKNGEKVVFTNGCFDLVHQGHVDYLFKSSQLGDRLVVGVNTDESVRKLKGPSRPIQNEMARCIVLASMGAVDAVVTFGDDTPFNLISAIIPNVLVKGSDWKVENIVGADVVMKHGGTVTTIDYIPGFSTSSIEKKIKGDHGNK